MALASTKLRLRAGTDWKGPVWMSSRAGDCYVGCAGRCAPSSSSSWHSLRCRFRPARRHSNPIPVGFTSTLTDNAPLARTAIVAVRHLDIEWAPDGKDRWTAKFDARQLFRKQLEAAGSTFDRLGPLCSAKRSLLDRDFAPVDRAMGSYLGGCRFVGVGCVALA